MVKDKLTLFAACIIAAISCERPASDVEVSSVSVSPSSIELEIGDRTMLKATVVPAAANDKTLEWASDNEKVAAVSDGAVTAVGEGRAVVSAVAHNGKSASCIVTVVASSSPDPDPDPDPDPNPEFVLVSEQIADLGLSVKWASWNIGASKPEEYGDYYAWGEVEVRDESTYKYNMWDHYRFGWAEPGKIHITKYCTNPENGVEDQNTILDPEDDAASVAWGDKWRMPTTQEMQELKKKCEIREYVLNGVGGYLFIGPNKNAIFLPKAGGMQGFQGKHAYYWTSSLSISSNDKALAFNTGVDSIEHGFVLETTAGRVYGLAVRAVYGERPQDGYEVNFSGTAVSDIGETSAVAVSKVTTSGGKIDYAGFCYGTGARVDVINEGNQECNVAADGTMRLELSGLREATSYKVRPFVSIESVRYYGDGIELNTAAEKAEQIVDLGLSVKWAGWNLGATKPEEYGGYYAWGETSPRTSFKETDSYAYWNGKEFTKYNKRDKKTILDPEDDAASVAWGSGWRIPTQSEWEELCRNTDHIKTVRNGVAGMQFTSKKNGKSIFFPFAGYYYKGDEIPDYALGHYGSYMSSQIRIKTGVHIDNSYSAPYCCSFGDEIPLYLPIESVTNRIGRGGTVRAVCQ